MSITINGATNTISSTGTVTLPTVAGVTSLGNTALGDAEASDTHAIKGATTLLANSASAALTVTQTGAGNAFVVEDSASTDSTPFVIDAGGAVITGHTASVPVWGFNNAMQNWAAFGYTAQGRFTNDAFCSFHTLIKSRSTTPGGFTVVQSGDALGRVTFAGADGSAYIAGAHIQAEVDGTPGTNDMPGRLVFSTTADGASSPTERMRIDSAGLITARNSTGLGYGAGSGGTVTQATSKSTSVTLNKPSGQITMNNDALAAGVEAFFQVSNSLVAATDIVVLTANWNPAAAYEARVYYTGLGVFNVAVKNVTAGSLSDAVVLNFAILKGSTS